MKILHLNTYDQGGAAIAAIRLHNALLKQSIDSSMLFLYKTYNYVSNSYGFEDHLKINPGFMKRQYKRFKKKLLLKYTHQYINGQKLKNKLQGFEIFSFNPCDFDITTQKIYQEADIIHLHWIAGFVDYRFFQKNKKPVIWTLHDMNPFTGGCHYSNGCKKYITECKNCPQLQGTINSNNSFIDQEYKEAFLVGQTHVITAPSQWLMNCSSESRLFGSFRNIYIPNCLDINTYKPLDKLFSRTALNLPLQKKILLFVSANVENKRKGFDLLHNAITQINEPDIHLCAIGGGKIASEYESRITFIDKISDERLMALAYSAADAFILPSREDNLPNTMIEALACGTPVIAFPVGGMLDVIKTGFNGIFCKELSTEGLIDAIIEFIKIGDQFDSAAIRKYIWQNFNENLVVGEYTKLYRTILDND